MRQLFLILIVLLVLPALSYGDSAKGQRYYMKNFKQKFKLNGLDFAQLHTQEEWRTLFDHRGEGFIKEFSATYPKQEQFLHNPKLWKKLQHVRDFAIEYASDTGNIPSCGGAVKHSDENSLVPQSSSSENLL